MISEERSFKAESYRPISHMLSWLYDLPEDYRSKTQLRPTANTVVDDDSIDAGPHTQSFVWECHDIENVFRSHLKRIMANVGSENVFALGQGQSLRNYIAHSHHYPDILLGAGAHMGVAFGQPNTWSTAWPEQHQVGSWHAADALLSQSPVVAQLASARNQIDSLRQTVDHLTDKIQALEGVVRESHRVLLALSQSYYWTPEWQAKEDRADEDAKLGRSRQYESVEELITDLNQ